ncbi:ABC transporter ATP-binding protein [Paenibacillus sp. ACRRX]|uniref:ABC transporter ATP-binding protein n=1 Tax=unclassified Paenibacillus TaxID=185978 RepID=UPI001EF4A366|nr:MULTISPECIES: ABC transporter ATP-binding protein [unclassified Paenibacillus]MCG7408526.1 ABC transporter ATP-binding protein [Paenibacillus sp. ACRRX]MDK8182774.1 ABC transporter ATP-binding protein [Paenibacillus sp. UMB4589-SE434]
MNAIEVNNLKKKYNDNYVVKGVSFNVKAGEIFGFLGKNGAGKTTTINMLSGIIRPTEGAFCIMGQTHTRMDMIKSQIGVMPDAANYYYEMTALNHLVFFSELKNAKVKQDQLIHILERVGLSGHERKKVKGFSFGMKKKLGIAQALIGDPKLIFLDEPTSGLDPESVVEIQQLIQELNAQHKTIFLTSHNLHEVEKLCSRIVIMEQGLITKYGSMDELKKQYQQHIELFLKIGPVPAANVQSMRQELSQYCTDLMFEESELTCSVSNEEHIPRIVYTLAKRDIDIYKVVPKQVTLEDIFFG